MGLGQSALQSSTAIRNQESGIRSMSKSALVTGASSGIGEVFARKLFGMGHRLILVARRKDRLEALATELGNAEVLTADLADGSDLQRVESRIAAEPELEFLVNNAGFGVQGLFHMADLESQDRMHRLHIIAIERLTHAALRGMVERRKGNIINVSSVAGFLATPFNTSYCATKSWINAFSEGIYLELKAIHSPVRIQALCPGFTYSEFHDVAGMDRNTIPRSLWMSAEYVVEDSLRGLDHNRLFAIPGWRYKLFTKVYPFVPRSLRHALAIRYGDSRQKKMATASAAP
jgi:short-subunit dehydrogenase